MGDTAVAVGPPARCANLPLIRDIEAWSRQLFVDHITQLGGSAPDHGKASPRHHAGYYIPKNLPANPATPEDAALWIEACSRLCIAGRADAYEAEARRGFTYACQILGLVARYTPKLIEEYGGHGKDKAIAHWAHFIGGSPKPRLFGHLYCAQIIGEPDLIKIGFSSNVEKRLLALRHIEGREVGVILTKPATILHEWAIHNRMLGAVRSEWYPRANVPGFLLPTGEREEAA